MCGIIGIASSQEINMAEILRKSLSWLTYRGYDSFGFAIKIENGLHVEKDTGTIEKLELTFDIKSRLGIGHTRWATHGAPSKENAHPHLDCSNDIAVVHNGIIDNYAELREKLETRGHSFKSETDTEIIPHLIEEKLGYYINKNHENPFLMAFRDAITELEGTFAIVAMWDKNEKLYAARRVNPLLIGIKDNVHFISSDIPAFIEYTNDFVPLEDNQIAVISADKFELYDIKLKEIIPQKYAIPFTVEEITKGEYDHYMLKEIQEQDKVLAGILNKLNDIEHMAEKILKGISESKKIYFIGCGSSFHACLAGKYMFERLLGLPSEAILSSEFKFSTENIQLKDTFIIMVSQSGETLDNYMALDTAISYSESFNLLALLNTPYSSIERLISGKLSNNAFILRLFAGPEICVVATKTYVAQLYMLALLTLQIKRKISSEENKKVTEDLFNEARKIPEKVKKVLESATYQMQELLLKYKIYSYEDISKGCKEIFFVIGRGINLATAYEGALKLREVCYISAEGMAGGELKHGSLAVVDRNTPVIVLFPPFSDNLLWKSIINNFREIQARGAPIISICCEGDKKEELVKLSKDVIVVPDTNWLFSPILQIISLQLLAYRIAVQKKLNPDYPRNLAKTVTVE